MPEPAPKGPIDPRLARPSQPQAPRPPPAAASTPATPQRSAPPPTAPAGPPPTLGELVEAGAYALVSPDATFGALGSRPEPGLPELTLALLAWGGVFTAISLVFALTRLNAGAWGTLPLAAAACGAVILTLPAGFIAGGLFHLLGGLSGGQRGFGRSLESAAALGAVPSLLVAALWAPDPGWLALPTLYGTYLAVTAAERLLDAPGGQAWMVLGVCGALAAGGEFVARDAVSLQLVRAENAATVLSNNPAASEEAAAPAPLSAPLAVPPAMPAAGPGADSLSGRPGVAGPVEADAARPAAAPSSLDMIRSGGGTPDTTDGSGAAPTQVDPRLQQAQAMEGAAATLLSTLRRQLEKPGAMKGLTPAQQTSIKGTLDQIDRGMAGGQGTPQMTPQQVQALLAQIMGTLRKPAAGATASGGALARPRRKTAAPAPPDAGD